MAEKVVKIHVPTCPVIAGLVIYTIPLDIQNPLKSISEKIISWMIYNFSIAMFIHIQFTYLN